MSALAELYSRQCVRGDHRWCSGEVVVPEDLVPAGQTSISCECLCHKGWPNRRGRR